MLATNQVAETETVVIVHLHLAVLATTLGSDQNHTEGRTATVDRRGSSILQNRDALDILWVDGVQVALHTVDQDQRRTA